MSEFTLYLLTRRLNISHSAVLCLFTARHQSATVANLQQALITPSVNRHRTAFLLIFNRLGATDQRQLASPKAPTFGAAFANGTTIACKPRLDLTLIRSPECDIISRRVNMTAILLAVSIMMMSLTSAETPSADVLFNASITAQQ